MRKGSVFGSDLECIETNYFEEIDKQLIELGLDKKSIEKNIMKNKKVSKKEADELAEQFLDYYVDMGEFDRSNEEENYLDYIRKGANLEYKEHGQTLLHFIIESNKNHVRNDKFSPVVMLLQNGADYNAVQYDSKNNYSCLMTSIENKDHDVFDLLLLMGANVNHVGTGGLTALHVAADENDTYVVEKLLKTGSLINAFAYFSRYNGFEWKKTTGTALMRAVWYSNLQIVKLLLKNGADVSLMDENGNTAFDYITGKEKDMFAALSCDYSSYKESNNTTKVFKKSLIEQAQDDLNKVMRK